MPEPAQSAPTEHGSTELVGTRTFLLTDVVGSTALWATDPGSASASIARHYELIDGAVRSTGGIRPLEQGEGDSSVAVFERAGDAVAAAVEIQRRFRAEPWPASSIEVRIGIHTGDAELRDGTSWTGTALNRCARLRSLAHGGQILLSAATAGVVDDHLQPGCSLLDLGEHELRGIARPERVHQLVHEDLPQDFPPLVAPSPAPSRLPTYLTSFVGRAGALAELTDLLERQRCVTLTGAGGCGKTRLAREHARRCTDTVHWVDLAALADPALVPVEVANSLGVSGPPAVDVVASIITHLGNAPTLVVLDNCEHLVSAAAELTGTLLHRCPELTVLVTSREALGIAGEHTWTVPSLDVPPEGAGADEVRSSEAGRLFLDRAVTVRRGFEVHPSNAGAVAEICRRLDGIPLALELAAARVRSLSPHDILLGLDDRFSLLTGGPRSAVARQRTLEASVAWSHELLTVEERALFRRLAVFAGGFTLAAAESVCASEELPDLAVLDLLSRLVDRSLVVMAEQPGGTRYELLETLRDFARHRLSDAGEAAVTRDRHLRHFLAAAEAAAPELESDRALEVAEELFVDLDNFRAAADWSLDAGHAEEARRLIAALNPFFFHHNLPVEFRQRLDRLRHLDGGSARSKALYLTTVLASHMLMFDPVGSQEAVDETLALVRELGDARLSARAHMWGGWLRALHGSPVARDVFEVALAASEDDDLLSRGLALVGSAFLDVLEADLHQADESLTAAEALYAGTRCPIDGYPTTMLFRTIAEVGRARLGPARTAAGNLEHWVEDMPRNWFRPLASLARGYVEYAAGRHDAAHDHFTEALDTATRLGNPLQFVMASNYMAQALVAAGELEEGRQMADATVALVGALDGTQFAVPAFAASARAALELGDVEGARRGANRLRASVEEAAGRYSRAWADRIDARLAAADGDLRQAEHHLHGALEIVHAGGVVYDVLAVLDALASVAARDDSDEEATRIVAAVEAERDRIGVPRWPLDEAEHESTLARGRAALADGFTAVWEQGGAMTLDEVVAYVRRARGERGRPSHGWASLTPTERTVVGLVVEGLTNPQIAERMFISRGTVRTHLTHVFRKLGVATRSELAAQAVRHNQTGAGLH